MIYATAYNPDNLVCTQPSEKTGFASFEELRQVIGGPKRAYKGMLIYEGVIFTRYIFYV